MNNKVVKQIQLNSQSNQSNQSKRVTNESLESLESYSDSPVQKVHTSNINFNSHYNVDENKHRFYKNIPIKTLINRTIQNYDQSTINDVKKVIQKDRNCNYQNNTTIRVLLGDINMKKTMFSKIFRNVVNVNVNNDNLNNNSLNFNNFNMEHINSFIPIFEQM